MNIPESMFGCSIKRNYQSNSPTKNSQGRIMHGSWLFVGVLVVLVCKSQKSVHVLEPFEPNEDMPNGNDSNAGGKTLSKPLTGHRTDSG